ncbi:MAG TPA: HU family DNA-binding protein [Rhizobiales bacterium]|nr:HU family DNA-binding protein [Hyphomicrobiales bacterium]
MAIAKKKPARKIKKAVKPAKKKTAAAKKPAAKKKTAKKGAKVVKPVVTVSLRNLADILAESHDIPRKQANAMLTELIELMTKNLKKGARIRIPGLGIFQVRKRPARMGRNPATGETIRIKASKKIAFRAAKDLKEAVM